MTTGTILLAGADPARTADVGRMLEEAGHTVVITGSGGDVLGHLKHAPLRFDAVIMPREAPGIDGLDVLNKIRSHPVLKFVPVVLESPDQDDRALMEGLRAGAHYYLRSLLDRDLLLTVAHTAVGDHLNYREMQRTIEHCEGRLTVMQAGHFQFRTLDEAQLLGKLLASAYPDADVVVVGLTELLVNAVEHGNLEIGYALKSRLLEEGTWREEIERRLATVPYRDRRVDVTFQRQPGEIRLSIRDQGPGFDWQSYLEIRPERVLDTHGRGIAIARQVSFDEVEYRDDGNEVEAVNYYPEPGPLDGGIEEY